LLAGPFALCASKPALAEYRERPMQLVVPFAAGGSLYVTARIEDKLKDLLGQVGIVAFEVARLAGNIELLLPALRAAQLYVVAGSPGAPDDMNDLFYTPSPKKDGRMCITVAEREETLARIRWPKRRISGEAILQRLPAAIEVLIVQPDGGDFLSREHLQWLRNETGKS
jgi:fimbrial chaperone protein